VEDRPLDMNASSIGTATRGSTLNPHRHAISHRVIEPEKAIIKVEAFDQAITSSRRPRCVPSPVCASSSRCRLSAAAER
jgi:hypothetical protein